MMRVWPRKGFAVVNMVSIMVTSASLTQPQEYSTPNDGEQQEFERLAGRWLAGREFVTGNQTA